MKTRIGLEIELNGYPSVPIDLNHWTVESEHCGIEIKSSPIDTFNGIRSLIHSMKVMNNSSTPSFFNAGNHLHIDFLHQFNPNPKDVTRYTSRKKKGVWQNPLGNKAKHFWVCKYGRLWKKPRDYMAYYKDIKQDNVYSKPIAPVVDAVKRFLLIAMRFDMVLFGFQHKDRMFNKYCHTLAHWSEDDLLSCETIEEICTKPSLLNDSRRHMFNPLSFQKFGTVEVRMMMGSIDPKEVWMQIFLFSRLSHLAKSNIDIPRPTGNVALDALALLNVAGIRGKIRSRLIGRLTQNMVSILDAKSICYSCEGVLDTIHAVDIGLSRSACVYCADLNSCGHCGIGVEQGSSAYNITYVPSLRCNLCINCKDSEMDIVKEDYEQGLIYIRGLAIHKSQLDENNKPKTLARILSGFKQN